MIALTGGGTGGHLAIVRALKNALNQRGIQPIYIGSTNGQDRAWFEHETGFSEKFFLNSQGVVNKKGWKKLTSLGEILNTSRQCKKIFKRYHVTDLVSVGGYSAAPASFATLTSHVKLYIHEQNAAMGKLNKILKPFATEFFSSYDPHSKIKDYPVDTAFFTKRKPIKKLETIIFLGGSQGAKAINTLAMQLAKKLSENNIHIIHQCGKNNLEEMLQFYHDNHINADVFDFDPQLREKILQADFAISRSGASTLWELCALGVPSLFIPYPYAASDHQYYNAKALVDEDLALLRRESEVDSHAIYESIMMLDLQHISTKLKQHIAPNGAEKIIDFIINHHT
ncbi:UDP-N-acetylglucosamine--N-acetylmuramyl-(pentapeptide) pyrophosphoryl-undecaprenol N-acetylglucosamine transferase [Sulfurospirillum sp. 1612]|uniref:UDP-N-acetylglucosamine--N-acetylmuramyl- (pentapeptide) pyrophosphoryl-undecaprenol N-acetylglucosamine transferase n=1 Tax=Sulfurospirillum sp. 1612 TaxID=3094835 RepID=UPI002F929C90